MSAGAPGPLASLMAPFFVRSVVLQQVTLVIQPLDKFLASLVVGVHQAFLIGRGQFFHEMPQHEGLVEQILIAGFIGMLSRSFVSGFKQRMRRAVQPVHG